MDDLPEEVWELLDNFADIVVDEFPNSLPPVRSIIHHIEFILGNVFQTNNHTDSHLNRMKR
jgi:hypothetical protein